MKSNVSPISVALGEVLGALIKVQGLRIYDLAAKVGIAERTLYSYCKGTTALTIEQGDDIAVALGTTVEDLITRARALLREADDRGIDPTDRRTAARTPTRA